LTRRILNKSSAGNATQFGSDDIDYINQLLTGTDQSGSDPVDINTTFKIRHGKLQISTSGGTNPITINSAASTSRTITLPDVTDTLVTLAATQTMSNKILTLPAISSISNSGTLTLPTGTTTLVGTDTTQTITGKTIAADSNTLTGVTTPTSAETQTNKIISAVTNTLEGVTFSPDIKIMGGFIGGGSTTTGFGFASGNITGVGTGSYTVGADGKLLNYLTGTVVGNQAGHRITGTTSGGAVTRTMKPRFKCRFRLNTTSTVRLYIGLHGRTAAFETGDAPLDTPVDAIFLCLRSTDTNFQIARNDNSGSTVFTDTGVAKDTSAHTIEIRTTSAGTGFEWSLDGGAFTAYTTDIPAANDDQYAVVEIETADSGVAKNFDVWYWFIESNPF
jgi:hypothetical protein